MGPTANLHHAYRLAQANGGAPGVNGVTFEQTRNDRVGELAVPVGRGTTREDVSVPGCAAVKSYYRSGQDSVISQVPSTATMIDSGSPSRQ
jgi:hypothetical protein